MNWILAPGLALYGPSCPWTLWEPTGRTGVVNHRQMRSVSALTILPMRHARRFVRFRMNARRFGAAATTGGRSRPGRLWWRCSVQFRAAAGALALALTTGSLALTR